MDLIEKLKNTFESEIESLGYELVDIEFKSQNKDKILTFFIYNDGGITVDDCEKVSGFLDQKLDELDLIKDSYYLEVSSPDLNRDLKTDRDLERNKEELLKVRLKNGETFIGKIKEIREENLVFDSDEKTKTIRRDDIKKINIEIVF